MSGLNFLEKSFCYFINSYDIWMLQLFHGLNLTLKSRLLVAVQHTLVKHLDSNLLFDDRVWGYFYNRRVALADSPAKDIVAYLYLLGMVATAGVAIAVDVTVVAKARLPLLDLHWCFWLRRFPENNLVLWISVWKSLLMLLFSFFSVVLFNNTRL